MIDENRKELNIDPNNPLGEAIAMAAAIAAGFKPDDKPISKLKKLCLRLLILLVSLFLIWRLQIGFVFVIFALIPSLVAYLMDTGRNRYLFKAVLCCNLTGAIPFVTAALAPNAGAAAIQLDMMKLTTWLIVYGSALGGWCIVWMCRLFSYATLSVTYTARKQFLEGTQEALVEEWGKQVQRNL